MKTEKKESLFTISQEQIKINMILDEMDGELTPEMEKALALNEKNLSAKGSGYVWQMEQNHAEIEFNKRIAEQAAKNIKRLNGKNNVMKSNLLDAVHLFGEFKAGIHKIGKRKSEVCEILDTAKVPAKYFTTTIVKKVDKAGIKALLKAGKKVKGAELVENYNLAIK